MPRKQNLDISNAFESIITKLKKLGQRYTLNSRSDAASVEYFVRQYTHRFAEHFLLYLDWLIYSPTSCEGWFVRASGRQEELEQEASLQ